MSSIYWFDCTSFNSMIFVDLFICWRLEPLRWNTLICCTILFCIIMGCLEWCTDVHWCPWATNVIFFCQCEDALFVGMIFKRRLNNCTVRIINFYGEDTLFISRWMSSFLMRVLLYKNKWTILACLIPVESPHSTIFI